MPGYNTDRGSGLQYIGPGPSSASKASANAGFTSTTGGTGAYAMLGIGATMTPNASGNVIVTVDGFMQSELAGTVGSGLIFGLAYGPGTPPVNYGGLTGTVAGTTNSFKYSAAPTSITNSDEPFGFIRLISGLQVGTVYWFDVFTTNYIPAARVNIVNPVLNIIEVV